MDKKEQQNSENKDEKKTDKIGISHLPVLNVGMFGHIDHGKTTLLYMLTGKWADVHSEELKRGITIKLGYADCIIRKGKQDYNIKEGEPLRYITFVDAPGHEMLMATMLSGAAIIDAAILVIAANEGIKPQTKEHLVALQAKKIKQFIIVQNKLDLVTKEQAEKNYHDIDNFLKGTVAENAPIIPVSAQQNINVDKILEAICNLNIPERDTDPNAIFAVARSFDINKPGTTVEKFRGAVFGGALKRGTLRVGDKIEIKPGLSEKKSNQLVYETLKTKIVSLHRGDYSLEKATPGGSLAIETELDPSISKADALSGCVIGLEEKLPEIKYDLKLKYSLFNEVLGIQEKKLVEPPKMSELLLLSINTSITVGTIKKIRDKNNEIELVLRIPVVPFKGESVGIARNIGGHWRLIGYGEILE